MKIEPLFHAWADFRGEGVKTIDHITEIPFVHSGDISYSFLSYSERQLSQCGDSFQSEFSGKKLPAQIVKTDSK